MNESFGLVVAECLMSGTPVITSNKGACPEIVTNDVGFLCNSEDDYAEAVRNIGDIGPKACREYAMDRFHYLRMCREYAREYEREIDSKNG